MRNIAIISSSVRDGRLSHRVSLYIKSLIESKKLANVEILDLKEYNFPLFNERLVFQKNPSEKVLEFTEHFNRADGIIIVTPVYNASFPASLKNIIDLYFKEWKQKIVAISSVTMGMNQAIKTVAELQSLLLKLNAYVIPTSYMPIQTGTAFSENGIPKNAEETEKYVLPMINELLFFMEKLHS